MRKENLRIFLPMLAVALALFLPINATADPKFSATVTPVQMVEGASSGCVDLVFKVTGVSEQQAASLPRVTALSASSAAGPILKFDDDTKPQRFAPLVDGGFYVIKACIQRMALNSEFTAPVLVDFSSIGKEPSYGEVLSFKITNSFPAVDADIIPGSDTLFLQSSRDTNFIVNVKGRPLRGMTVCQSTLADANTGNHLDERYLNVYLDDAAYRLNPQEDSKFLTLTASSTNVHLAISPEFQSRGIFTGNVALCATNKGTISTFKLTVNSSNSLVKLLGGILIFVGICLYVLVAVVLRQRANQLTALLPASRLVEALQNLEKSAQQIANQSKVNLPILLGNARQSHSLKSLIDQLSLNNLRKNGFLPPLLTNPFQPASISADFQQFLQQMSAQELNLVIIVRDGLEYAMSLDPRPDLKKLHAALAQLDKLALEADSPDPMRPKVDAIVNGIVPGPNEFAAAISASNFQGGRAASQSVHEITIQLEYLSGVGWLVWALLSLLMGSAVLILNNHGFGTWQDLFKCFLWGLGVQAAGQGLQALTPASAVSTFSLQIGH
jgi:hypothetical protein